MPSCTNHGCEEDATKVLAVPGPSLAGYPASVFVAPYCDEHAAGAQSRGAVFAGGPALSEDVRDIEGVRR